MELHDGTVSVSSPGPGLGAEFVVRLATRPPEAVATAAAKPAPATLGRRVLLIDDDRDAVESLKEALELDANEVEVALDGTEGIEKARHFAPDVVVCDISLPRMDGYEVARRMREDPQLRSVGLVALTGHALDEDVERCRAAGFDRHVAKPPDPRALQETISELRRDPRAQQAPPPPGRAAR